MQRTRTTRKAARLVGLALAAALVTAACGSEGGGAGAGKERASGATAVRIEVFKFVPGKIEVARGTTVAWTNRDDILHTVTSGTPRSGGVPGVSESTPAKPDGVFDGQLQGKGSTFRFTFREAGTFTYYCDVHTGMEGTVVVR